MRRRSLSSSPKRRRRWRIWRGKRTAMMGGGFSLLAVTAGRFTCSYIKTITTVRTHHPHDRKCNLFVRKSHRKISIGDRKVCIYDKNDKKINYQASIGDRKISICNRKCRISDIKARKTGNRERISSINIRKKNGNAQNLQGFASTVK